VSDQLALVLFFGSFGTIFLISGLLIRVGAWKAWLATERIPVLVSPSFGFGLIPAGLMFLFSALVFLVEHDTGSILLCCGAVPSFSLAVVFPIWQPWWILPVWYRSLKEDHGDIIPILREEAQAMGRRRFQERVATQEGLEQWIAEVRQKRGLD
jgi:hypothetical protein